MVTPNLASQFQVQSEFSNVLTKIKLVACNVGLHSTDNGFASSVLLALAGRQSGRGVSAMPCQHATSARLVAELLSELHRDFGKATVVQRELITRSAIASVDTISRVKHF